jgi:hypothetical protein
LRFSDELVVYKVLHLLVLYNRLQQLAWNTGK